MTFDLQVVWKKNRYLRDGLLGHENVLKIPVKNPADNLNEKNVVSPGDCFCEHHYLHPTQRGRQSPRAGTSWPPRNRR